MVDGELAARLQGSIDAVAPLAPNAWLRYDVITRLLPAGVTDVLEIGCGQGALGARLSRRYRYLGLEPDKTSYEVARRRLSLAGGVGEVRNIEFAALSHERADLVCAFEVLEHIEDDMAAVKEWAGRLRPGGWLILSVPAHQRRFGAFDVAAGHFRRYDPSGLASLLTNCGLTDVTIRQYGFPLGYLLEAGRNQVAQRRLSVAPRATPVERTAGSGRLLQPSGRLVGTAIRWGTAPFRIIQRAFPAAGTGLVALARSTSSGASEVH